MLAFATFNRTTVNILVASFFALGGAFAITAQAQDVGSWQNTFACGACSSTSDGMNTVTEDAAADAPLLLQAPRGSSIQPTTVPSIHYSWTRHRAAISGVVFAEGQPLPHAKVTVLVTLDGGFDHEETVWADGKGAYGITVRAPSRIASVTVTAPDVCRTGDERDCRLDYNIL